LLKRCLLFFFVALILSNLVVGPFLVFAQSFQYVLGTDFYASPAMSFPQKGMPFFDPDFHSTIVRVTDKSDGYLDPGIENEYAKTDPENCDGASVILRGNAGEWYLYDTVTFEMTRHFGNWFVDGVEQEPRWSATDPGILFYVYETELRSYNLDSDSSEIIHDFKAEFPSASYITTGSEGNPSMDQRYWAFMVEDSNHNSVSAVVYDMQTDSVVGHRENFPDKVEDISMDISGSHVMVGFDSHVFQICSRDFTSIRDMPLGANGHNDFALTSDGRDVLVYQNIQNDYICMTDLDTLVETRLLQIPFGVNMDIGLHISGNCVDKPGWILVSTYGAKQPPPGQIHSWLDTQLFMLQLQENPAVWRIAHTQAYQSDEYMGDKNYFAEAYATINKEGSRVYFGSNWGDFTPEYTDTYLVGLQSEWNIIVASATTSPIEQTPLLPSPTPTVNAQPPNALIIDYAVLAIVSLLIVVFAVVVLVLRKTRF
jgi:hypothetical protein